MALSQGPEKTGCGPAGLPPGSRAAVLAVVLYFCLLLAIRNTAGGFPLAPAIGDLDGRLYAHYLDALAWLQSCLPARWAAAFLSTVATECAILGLLLWKRPFPEVAKAGFIANLSTHPIFWYALAGIEHDYAFWVVALEFAISVVEALILFAALRNLGLRQAVLLSLAANGGSFFLGLLHVG